MRAREHASAISQCGHALCGAPRRAMKRRRAVRRGIVRRCATRRTVFVTIAAVAIVFVVRVSQPHSAQRGCRGRRSRTARARISRRFGAHVLSRKRLDALRRVRAVARSRAVTTKAARARVGRRRSVAHVAARQGHHARGAAARRRRRRPERSQRGVRRAHCGACRARPRGGGGCGRSRDAQEDAASSACTRRSTALGGAIVYMPRCATRGQPRCSPASCCAVYCCVCWGGEGAGGGGADTVSAFATSE